MTDRPSHDWTVRHFSQANPEGPGQGNVPNLLRRVADSIESLGEVEVYDVTFHSEVTGDENRVSMTVYWDPNA
jgi:hypothetical protein